MVLGDENRPLIHGKMTHPFLEGAVFIDVAFASGLAVGISASIHRIGQDVVKRRVSGSDPADRARLAIGSELQGKQQAFGAKPEPHTTRRTELGEALENGADGAGDGFVWMKKDFTILFSPHETNRQPATQFAASRFIADTAVESGTNDMEFSLGHGPLQSEDQAIVKKCWVIDTIIVSDESVGDATQLQQAIPVGIVAYQTRDFQTEDDAHVSQGHFTGHASKPGTFVGAGAGEPKVFINDDHLLLAPAELTGFVGQGVLAGGGFAIVHNLRRRGLAKIDEGGSLGMRLFDFGRISHWFAPGVCRLGLLWLGDAPASR